jgi:hypothetical protein
MAADIHSQAIMASIRAIPTGFWSLVKKVGGNQAIYLVWGTRGIAHPRFEGSVAYRERALPMLLVGWCISDSQPTTLAAPAQEAINARTDAAGG